MTDTTQPPAETLAAAKARAAKRAASGDVHIEGSIYEGMAACLTRHGATIAHVVKYEDAVEIAAALKAARDFIVSTDNTSGCCMCGSPVEGHGMGDGHSPVDEGSYHAAQVVECIDQATSALTRRAGGDAIPAASRAAGGGEVSNIISEQIQGHLPRYQTNTGHGHVWPRPDGSRARCGGEGLCSQCAKDAADLAEAKQKVADEPANLIREAATLIAPGVGEVVFYIRVRGDYQHVHTKAGIGAVPETALRAAIDALQGELLAVANCPHHAGATIVEQAREIAANVSVSAALASEWRAGVYDDTMTMRAIRAALSEGRSHG